jgi:hypothetical protein
MATRQTTPTAHITARFQWSKNYLDEKAERPDDLRESR